MENEPWMDEARRDRAQVKLLLRRPTCLCCEQPIASEQCISLRDLGLNGYLCEFCADLRTVCTCDLEV